jgi:hypothetical protein
MTAAVGFPTLRLVRVRIGNVHLGNLKAGEVLEVLIFLPLLGLILYFLILNSKLFSNVKYRFSRTCPNNTGNRAFMCRDRASF